MTDSTPTTLSPEPAGGHGSLPLLVALVVACIAGVASYAVWFGWSDPIDTDYAGWQWTGGVVTFAAAAAALGWGRRVLTACLVLPSATTAAWFQHAWGEDEMGLSVIGIPIVFACTAALGAVVGGVADFAAERRAG